MEYVTVAQRIGERHDTEWTGEPSGGELLVTEYVTAPK
jgi:hypothetical protein